MDRTKELRVIITCLVTLSENPGALQRMASDKSLVIVGLSRFYECTRITYTRIKFLEINLWKVSVCNIYKNQRKFLYSN